MSKKRVVRTLAELAHEANECHRHFENSVENAIRFAKQAGDALNAAKKQMEHGEWTPWLQENFKATPETARGYMRIAKNWKHLHHVKDAKDLSINRALNYLNKHMHEHAEATRPEWMDADAWEAKQEYRRALRGLGHEFRTWIKEWSHEEVIFAAVYSRMVGHVLQDWLGNMREAMEPLVPVFLAAMSRWHNASEDGQDDGDRALSEAYKLEILEAFRDCTTLTPWQKETIHEIAGDAKAAQDDPDLLTNITPDNELCVA